MTIPASLRLVVIESHDRELIDMIIDRQDSLLLIDNHPVAIMTPW